MNKRTEPRQHSTAAPTGHSRKGKTTRRATRQSSASKDCVHKQDSLGGGKEFLWQGKACRLEHAYGDSTGPAKQKKRAFLTSYDSMSACSGATGIPLATLRQAKRAGCPAFAGSRVDLPGFIAWWFNQPDDHDAGVDWGQRLKRALAQREELRLSRDRNLLCVRDEAVRQVNGCLSDLHSNLERKFSLELPPDLVGRTAVDISERLMGAVYEVNRACKERWNRWADEEEAAQPVGPTEAHHD